MIKSAGHHTIEKTAETVGQRLQLGPVKSVSIDKAGNQKAKPPFAGDGYYFWEDNMDAAEWWGQMKYARHGKHFRVFRIDIELRYDDGTFLDLIGNRQHLKFLGLLIKKTRMNVAESADWKFHHYIAYFRRQENKKKGMFPYKMIRFNDAKLNPKIQEPLLLNDAEKMALLNPFYIICVFDITDLNLPTFTFIK